MRRREFIAAGLVLGVPLATPGLASAIEGTASANWLVSHNSAADPLVLALAEAGAHITRVPDEAAALWYDHVALALDRGEVVRGITGAGSGFLIGQFAHLRGRLAASPRMAALAAGASLDVWEILPRHALKLSENTQ